MKLTEKKFGALYVSQQKILDQFIKDNRRKIGLGFNIDDYPDLYDQLMQIHPAETLWSDIERYVIDNRDKFAPYATSPWGESVDPLLRDDEKECLNEIMSPPYAPEHLKRQMELLKLDIAKTKRKIIQHHKRYGAHEMGVDAWADKLISKLEDKWRINDLKYGGYQIERDMFKLLVDFYNWAINYEGQDDADSDSDSPYLPPGGNFRESLDVEAKFMGEYKRQKARLLKLVHSYPITPEKEDEIKHIRYEVAKLKSWLQSKGLLNDKPDFTKAIDTQRIKNMSNAEIDMIAKMFGEDVKKYATDEEKMFLAESVANETKDKARIILKAVTGKDDWKLTAKTVGFQDLARDEMVFVTIHGWEPKKHAQYYQQLKDLAHKSGFAFEFSTY